MYTGICSIQDVKNRHEATKGGEDTANYYEKESAILV